MRSAALALLISSLVVACAAEDPYPLRPPGGGGHGTVADPPDAGVVDAAEPDGAIGPLTGRVCVIRDVTDPFACAVLGAGVGISAVGGGTTATSDGAGAFTIELVSAPDVLELGAALDDGLVTTRSSSDLTGPPVDAPVLDEALRDEIIQSLEETQDTGAMLVYVRDNDGPVAGATVSTPLGRIFYDVGDGTFDRDAAVTGPDGIALVLDTAAGTVTANEGDRSANAAVPTVVDGFGIGVILLPSS